MRRIDNKNKIVTRREFITYGWRRGLITCGCLISIIASLSAREKETNIITGKGIAGVTIQLLPPDDEIEITDVKEFENKLSDIKFGKKDTTYEFGDKAGQLILTTIEFESGKIEEIKIGDDHVMIDGVMYKAEYSGCEAFNEYANSLRNGK